MKASHRKDVIIARIIFAIICAALLAGIISLIVWLHGRNAGKTRHRKRKSQIMHRRQTTAICHR